MKLGFMVDMGICFCEQGGLYCVLGCVHVVDFGEGMNGLRQKRDMIYIVKIGGRNGWSECSIATLCANNRSQMVIVG